MLKKGHQRTSTGTRQRGKGHRTLLTAYLLPPEPLKSLVILKISPHTENRNSLRPIPVSFVDIFYFFCDTRGMIGPRAKRF